MNHRIIAAALLLGGCATQQPQNAEEFRRAVPGAMMTKTESFEVNRSFREVGASFQRRAPECLGVSVRTTSQTSTSYQVITATYKPTVRVGSDRAELHVQRDFKGGGVITVGNPPPGGPYLLVVDATPIAANRSRVQWWGISRGHDVLYRAIRAWATGESNACPDMTKIG